MLERGIPVAKVLEGTGINPAQLDDIASQVTSEQYSLVVANMITLTETEDLGIEMGRALRPSDYGLLGYAMANSKDLRRLSELWHLYNHSLYGAALQARTEESAGHTSIYANILLPPGPAYRFCMEEFLFSVLAFLRVLTRTDTQLARLELRYSKPRYHAKMMQLLNCPIEYEAATNRIVRAGRLMDEPLVSTNLELFQLYSGLCEKLAGKMPSEMLTGKIRAIFLRQPDRLPSLQSLAREFNISERTLERRLRAEGRTYRDMVNQFRHNYAIEYLRTTKLSCREIAFSLGYQDDKAFLRAFKNRSGMSPSEFRDLPGK